MLRLGLLLLLMVVVGCKRPAGAAKDDQDRLNGIAAIYEKGYTAKSIVKLNAYLKDYPQDDLAWTILGHAYEGEDRTDEAKSAYQSAIKINPRQFQAITGMGIIHRSEGNYDAAMNAYKKALEIDDKYAQAYSSMTTIALKRNEDAKALEYAKKGYELDKSDPVIAANLAVAYHYNNDTVNREKFATIAEKMGYANVEALRQIFSGELTIRD